MTGAGLSTGETTEQANAYISRLALTTKHMHKASKNVIKVFVRNIFRFCTFINFYVCVLAGTFVCVSRVCVIFGLCYSCCSS